MSTLYGLDVVYAVGGQANWASDGLCRGGDQVIARKRGPPSHLLYAIRMVSCDSSASVSKRLGSRYRSGRFKEWLKFKNPDAPRAVKREAEEEWGKDKKPRQADGAK